VVRQEFDPVCPSRLSRRRAFFVSLYEMRMKAFLLACICLVLAGAGCGFGRPKVRPLDQDDGQAITALAERFFAALRDGDDGALTEAVFKGLPPPERVAFSAAIQPLVGLTSFSIGEVGQSNKGVATVNAEVVTANSKSRQVVLGLVASKGSYYVANVQASSNRTPTSKRSQR